MTTTGASSELLEPLHLTDSDSLSPCTLSRQALNIAGTRTMVIDVQFPQVFWQQPTTITDGRQAPARFLRCKRWRAGSCATCISATLPRELLCYMSCVLSGIELLSSGLT